MLHMATDCNSLARHLLQVPVPFALQARLSRAFRVLPVHRVFPSVRRPRAEAPVHPLATPRQSLAMHLR